MASLVRNDWGESEEWWYFSDSDLLSPEDKICEARFFLSQMQSEEDWDRFRWLTTAFVNAAYAFFEQVAMLAYYRSTHPDTGEPLPDREVLQRLDEYVVVFFENKRGRVKTGGKHPELSKLYELRRGAIHHFPMAIRSKSTRRPDEFRLEDPNTREGTPVLAFCRTVVGLMEKAWDEARDSLL